MNLFFRFRLIAGDCPSSVKRRLVVASFSGGWRSMKRLKSMSDLMVKNPATMEMYLEWRSGLDAAIERCRVLYFITHEARYCDSLSRLYRAKGELAARNAEKLLRTAGPRCRGSFVVVLQ
jgi:hypothetical protein